MKVIINTLYMVATLDLLGRFRTWLVVGFNHSALLLLCAGELFGLINGG